MRWASFIRRRRNLPWLLVAIPLVVWYYNALPDRLFEVPYSTVLEAKNGELLSASIAADGQWRFPMTKAVPDRFSTALILFEDKRFFSHPGVDVLSLGRAVRQNINRQSIVSGGSTITMQVIRLSRRGRSRTVLEKITEMILATRLELRYSKHEILAMYASHAPFGGNVVGVEAACWRYFGRSEKDLSWAEAALLAVLPNAPSLIHPGKNREVLKMKRDRLLDRLRDAGKIDEFTCTLAKEEEIPDEPVSLPGMAGHLLTRMKTEGAAQTKVRSTIDFQLQQAVEQIAQRHHHRLRGSEVHNAAAVVARVNTGEVMAYIGNVGSGKTEGADVDIVVSPRSTGSILKPFLFAALLDEGKILPKTLLPDIPTFINGFVPRNFSHGYDGAVPADKALIRSLNIPAVHMLRDFRYERFHALLTNMGMTTLNRPPDHYGLSLILGGAEGTLWDITGIYASMARTLNNYFIRPGHNKYRKSDFHPLSYTPYDSASDRGSLSESSWLGAASIYLTFDALQELYRPGEETGWRYFQSARRIAWKTGTSFGFRDGWAVGVTGEYVVGVWVGNADGEGRPGLTGTDAAAPLMFDIFSLLPGNTWFEPPTQDMEMVQVCHESGLRISAECERADSLWVGRSGFESTQCIYHKKVHLSGDRKYQVNSSCASVSAMEEAKWFVLPPLQEYYYRNRNPSYKPLPGFHPDCPSPGNFRMMDVLYPKPGAKVFIPRDLFGNEGNAIFQITHRNPRAMVFWHLDGTFIASTQRSHRLPVNPPPGRHTLLIVDESGETLEQVFEVLPRL